MTCSRCMGHAVFCKTCMDEMVSEARDDATRRVHAIWATCLGVTAIISTSITAAILFAR